MRTILLLVTILISLGCTSTQENFVFDGSSEESIQNSINTKLKSLSSDEQAELLMALLAIQLSDLSSATELIGDPSMQSMNYDVLRKKLDGLTYEQLLELAANSQTTVVISTD